MSKRVDPKLLEVAAKFSAPPQEQTPETMPDIRIAARNARIGLVGRHANEVEILEEGSIRRFVPRNGRDRTVVILYIHGGGWINCDTVTHGAIMCDLAAITGHEVIGPDYPLAPENPYPAGLDVICDLALQIRAEQPNAHLVLGGDSAGANLALATALRLRDEGHENAISALLLWYGCFRKKFDTSSHIQYGGGEFGLTTQAMRGAWDWYLGDAAEPIYGDLTKCDTHNLPPCYLAEAELDCLADDTRWLANKLNDTGIPHTYALHLAVNHGFIHFSEFYQPSYDAIRGAAHFLKAPGMMRGA